MASVAYREPISTTVGKRMIFTGPDYRRDHLPKLQQHVSYIGEERPLREKTGDLKYLWRPASSRSLPAKYKHEYVGEIGWGIPEYNFINRTRLESGFHIKYKELSQAAIDEISHRYQNPWQPKPYIMNMLGRFSRGQIAWNMGDYEDTNRRNSKGATLVRQSKAALPRASRPTKLSVPPKTEEKRRFRPRNQHESTCYY
ncbi:protein SPMIP2 [Saccopteryx bilineata]|uniref:protein SPMIP2 n=1 Tax=Saccopteryx bilineata TaxID=59482 RepID=UPI00338EF0BD